MDFSSILGSEIKKKRKQNNERKKLKRPKAFEDEGPRPDKAGAEVEASKKSNEVEGDKKIANAKSQEKTADKDEIVADPKVHERREGPTNGENKTKATEISAEEQRLIDSVSEEKLDAQIREFGVEQQTDGWTKSEKLQFVRSILEKEDKKRRYKEILEKESSLDSNISVEDILDGDSEEILLRIRVYIKSLVHQWEANVSGEQDEHLLDETKRDLVKLMYKLRVSKVAPDMKVSLATIMYYLQIKDFMKANESYMKLSIGNVAWPIGVQHVGIHARGAASKITGQSLSSNIMTDERTRRWITAVKRLISFVERTNAHH